MGSEGGGEGVLFGLWGGPFFDDEVVGAGWTLEALLSEENVSYGVTGLGPSFVTEEVKVRLLQV